VSTIDQQFVEYIVKSIVENPDAVKIERTIDEKGVLLELTVSEDDLGRVIGKRGALAQSLRTLLRALGTKNDARYNLKIVDVGDGGSRKQRNDETRDEVANKSEDSDNSYRNDDEVVAETETEVEVEEPQTEEESDVVSQTRRELEDLDDLDI
jgi:uncharacterized protein